MSEWNERNAPIIDEFRANAGQVESYPSGPMLILTTTGAKTGRKRTNPLVYLPDGDRLIVFASKGGASTNPDWYHNLVANPKVTIEVGSDTAEATATVVQGEERDRLYAEQVARLPQFADYQARTTRRIPVIALERERG